MTQIVVEVRCQVCDSYYEIQYTSESLRMIGNAYGMCPKCVETNSTDDHYNCD